MEQLLPEMTRCGPKMCYSKDQKNSFAKRKEVTDIAPYPLGDNPFQKDVRRWIVTLNNGVGCRIFANFF